MDKINTDIAVPLYKQLCAAIKNSIKSGEYPVGKQLPSEEKLCEMYNISRISVRNAIKCLVDEGLLFKKQGKGTYVAMPTFIESVSAGGSFTRSCQQHGVVPGTKIISCAKETAPQFAQYCLGVEKGKKIICVSRLRFVDDVPVILEYDFFRNDFEFLLQEDMTNIPISEIIKKHTGNSVTGAEDMFNIVNATKKLAQHLSCAVGTPILRVDQKVMTNFKQVLYCNQQYILTDKYKYAVAYTL